MALRDEIESSFTDRDKLVNPKPCKPTDYSGTGNGLLYTSLYYIQLAKRNELKFQDYKTFTAILSACQVPITKTISFSGLFNRSPEKTEEMESADDYYGIAACGKILSYKISKDIMEHGVMSTFWTFRWIFNNLIPSGKGSFTGSSWFARFPWFPAHLQWSAGKQPNFIRRIAWAAKITIGAFSSNPNARILDWLMLQSVGDSWMCSKAIALWWKKLNEYFPGGMPQVLSLYFSPDCPDHPLAKYWLD